MKNGMKLILLFAMVTIIWSCNETPKKDVAIEKKAAKTEKAEKKNSEAQMLEELENTQPVNADDLEAWMPKTLGGLSLERTKSSPIFPGEVRMNGWYKRVGDKMITLSVADAAGPSGGMSASKISLLGTEREYDTEAQQHRSVNVKGRMAAQVYHTEANMTLIMFFHKKRFMLMLTAHDHDVEETWGLVDELDFNALDNLIK